MHLTMTKSFSFDVSYGFSDLHQPLLLMCQPFKLALTKQEDDLIFFLVSSPSVSPFLYFPTTQNPKYCEFLLNKSEMRKTMKVPTLLLGSIDRNGPAIKTISERGHAVQWQSIISLVSIYEALGLISSSSSPHKDICFCA